MESNVFKIDNSRQCFYQWDVGQKLVVLDGSITAVNYYAEGEETAYKIPVIGGRAQVPDELLQKTDNLVVWAMVYDGSQYTKTTATFGVIARQRPSDYVYTPTEYETFSSKLDKGGYAGWEDAILQIDENGEIQPSWVLDDYLTCDDGANSFVQKNWNKNQNAGKLLQVNGNGVVEPNDILNGYDDLDDFAGSELSNYVDWDNFNDEIGEINDELSNKLDAAGYAESDEDSILFITNGNIAVAQLKLQDILGGLDVLSPRIIQITFVNEEYRADKTLTQIKAMFGNGWGKVYAKYQDRYYALQFIDNSFAVFGYYIYDNYADTFIINSDNTVEHYEI